MALGGGGAAVAWLLCGRGNSRALLTFGAALVGIVVVPALTSSAPPAASRIAERLDDAKLPGRIISQREFGSTRCSPLCPQLERSYRIEGVSYAKTSGQVQGLLRAAGFTVVALPPASRRQEVVEFRADRIRCTGTVVDVATNESRFDIACQGRRR